MPDALPPIRTNTEGDAMSATLDGWWSPYQWPGGARMSWDSVGTLIMGAIFTTWWGMSDDEAFDLLYVIGES